MQASLCPTLTQSFRMLYFTVLASKHFVLVLLSIKLAFI